MPLPVSGRWVTAVPGIVRPSAQKIERPRAKRRISDGSLRSRPPRVHGIGPPFGRVHRLVTRWPPLRSHVDHIPLAPAGLEIIRQVASTSAEGLAGRFKRRLVVACK